MPNKTSDMGRGQIRNYLSKRPTLAQSYRAKLAKLAKGTRSALHYRGSRRSRWPKLSRRQSFRRRGFRPETEILSLRLLELLAQVEKFIPEKRSNIPVRLTMRLVIDWLKVTGNARLDQGIDDRTVINNLNLIPCSFCHASIDLNETVYINQKERIAVDQAHIESLAHGGSTSQENISLSCIPCNRAAKDMHMIEFMIRQNLPGLAAFEARDPETVAKYRQLVRETLQAQRLLQKKLPRGTVSPQTWKRLKRALTAPIHLRQQIIQAIHEL